MDVWIHELGHRGQEVKRIQRTLGNLAVDGDFGKKTEQAVKDFQASNLFMVDGRVGPQTRQGLEIEIYPGIDVSNWQGDINWDMLAKTDLAKFCWVKVTEGNNHVHPRHKKNISESRRVGIPVGGYHFARPDLHGDPHKEVRNFVKYCPTKPGDLRPVLDFERAGDHSPSSIRQWVIEFLQEVETLSGIRPIIYTGGNMTKYKLRGNTSLIDDYTLWHAYYNKKALKKGIKPSRLGQWKEWRIWQWTGSGQLSGITGKVDRNWLVGGQAGLDDITIS